jgi:hypothetical protein
MAREMVDDSNLLSEEGNRKLIFTFIIIIIYCPSCFPTLNAATCT